MNKFLPLICFVLFFAVIKVFAQGSDTDENAEEIRVELDENSELRRDAEDEEELPVNAEEGCEEAAEGPACSTSFSSARSLEPRKRKVGAGN